MSGNVVHIEGLGEENDYNSMLQKLPELNLVGIRQKIFDLPVYYQFSLQAANLVQTSQAQGSWHSVKRSTKRFNVYPQIVYPLNFGQWFSITANAGLRETWYIDSQMDLSNFDLEGLGKVKTYSFLADNNHLLTGGRDGEIFDREGTFEGIERHGNDVRRSIYDCGLSLSGPSVHKIFSVSGWGNIDKIEHLITPALSYNYIPAVNQSLLYKVDLSGDGDPETMANEYNLNYDSTDYIGWVYGEWGRNYMTYSITNRLRAKSITLDDDGQPQTEYRDLVTLKFMQQYDFRMRKLLQKPDYAGYTPYLNPLSNIGSYLTLNPTKTLEAKVDLYYNPHNNCFERYYLSGDYKSESWNAELGFRATDPVYPGSVDTRYLTAKIGCAPHPKIELFAEVNYNIIEDLFNQNQYAIVYHSQCWSVTFFAGHEAQYVSRSENGQSYIEREEETQFSIVISLKNVGSSKVPFM